MRARSTLLAALAAAATVGGCACEKLPSTALTDCRQGAIVQGAVKTDILFVIDNSGSMTQEIDNLKANLASFVAVLNSSPIANDFQIGITTVAVQDFDGTMIGLQGRLIGPVAVPGSSPARNAGPILLGSSSTLLPALPDVGDFAALVDAAIASGETGKEQPFRAMELALSSPLIDAGQPNAGFLRPGARLAVVMLSDEDDCSDSATTKGITATTVSSGNDQCHNDYGDGVDYKFGRIDPIAGYASFLDGAIGGEARDVVLGAIVGVDATTLDPTCGSTGNGWCCGSTLLNSTTICPVGPPACGSRSITNAGLAGSTYCCGNAAAPYCRSTCASAFDKADRFAALLATRPFGKTITGSICDASFQTSLELIAGLIISPTVPISGEPADPNLLVVSLQKTDGSTVACAAGTDYTYAPASGAKPATVTFLEAGACSLSAGDQIKIDVICAG